MASHGFGGETAFASSKNALYGPEAECYRISNCMGDYHGRRNNRRRKARFIKDQRVKAVAALKKTSPPPQVPDEPNPESSGSV